MHCGLCLPTCPTYELTLNERHSPRGRIALTRAIADGRLTASRIFAEEMYLCLGCLACTSACPAGVKYGEIFEHARAEVERLAVLDRFSRRFARKLLIEWLFDDLRRLRFFAKILRFYKKSGLQRLVRSSGLLRLFPKSLQRMEQLTPDIAPAFSNELIPEVRPAIGPKRYTVAMLTGCVQDVLYSEVNRDCVDVLAVNGCEVWTPRNQSCCGSLHAHNGELELARKLAKMNIDLIPPEQYDAIISNAGGCGSHLKRYDKLLESDPRYKQRAQLWVQKVKDIHEWLVQIGFRRPNVPDNPKLRVTYHESCHLAHGQQIRAQPREILRSIPYVELVELPESSWCCGSAGIYNIIQPEISDKLLLRKLRNIQSTGAQVVASANTGCNLQLSLGLDRMGILIRVAHPISLLAEAYRREGLI